MTLQEIFDQLTYGELSQISMGGGEQGEISKTNYPRVMAHITLGLTTLYKRFYLKEGRVTIQLDPNQKTYVLDSRADTLFLPDEAGEDFNDDILKIEEITDDLGNTYDLNDKGNPCAILTPTSKSLRVPERWPDNKAPTRLILAYRANHPAIKNRTNFNPSNVYVELPDSHLEALLLFIASRVNNPIGMTNEFHAGNSYAVKFEQECQRLEMANLQVDQGQQSTRLKAGGWV